MSDAASAAPQPSPEHGLRSYVTGFVLAIVLTAIPFAIVYFSLLPTVGAVIVIAVCAIVQVVVHLHYFLHINFRDTPRENLLALAFAGILILIMVGGSLWIMFDLHYRMML